MRKPTENTKLINHIHHKHLVAKCSI